MTCQKDYHEKFVGLLMITILILSVFSPLVSFISKGVIENAKADNNSLKAGEDDWVITSDVYLNGTDSNRIFVRDCNIIIEDNGCLHLNNSTLTLLIDEEEHAWNITVKGEGSLKLWNSTIRTDTQSNLLRPFLKTDINVRDGSRLVMEHNSSLKFPGFVYINDSELIMKDSKFDKIDNVPTYDYLWDGKTNDQADVDDNDDCPRLIVDNDSNVVLEDSEIRNYYENDNFRDPTDEVNSEEMSWYPIGERSLEERDQDFYEIERGRSLGVNEWYLANPTIPREYLDEYPYINPFHRITSLYVEVVYKTEINYTSGAHDYLEYYSPQEGNFEKAIPLEYSQGWTSPKASDIWEIDFSEFRKESYFDTARLVKDLQVRIENTHNEQNSSIHVDKLRLISSYDNDIHVRNSKFTVINSYIDVDYVDSDIDPRIGQQFSEPTTKDTWMEDSKMDHTTLRMVNTNFKSYGLSISNDEPQSGKQYGDPWVIADETSTDKIWMYRWVNLTVTNHKGVPIPNARVKAEPNNGISSINQIASQQNILSSNLEAWDYLNRTGKGYYDQENEVYVTDENGNVTMILVSDRINYPEEWPNSQFIGNYELMVNYTDPMNEIQITSSEKLSLDNFPSMNNTINYTFEMDLPLPDLVSQDSDLKFLSEGKEDGSISVGETLDVNLTVHNIGDLLSSDFKVSFYIDNISEDNRFDTVEVSSISPSENLSVITSWVPDTEGDYTIIADIDPDDEVVELNESNNMVEKELIINEKPDLTVANIDSEEGFNVMNHTTLHLTADVANFGGTDANDVEVVFSYLEDDTTVTEISSVRMDVPIDPTPITTPVVTWEDPTVGEYKLVVEVDPGDEQDEIDEDNNVAERDLIVTSEPDLVPVNFDISQESVQSGDTLRIQTQVLNQGGFEAGNVNVSFYVDYGTSSEELITTDSTMISGLDVGETSRIIEGYWYNAEITTEELRQERNITVIVNHPRSEKDEVITGNNQQTRKVEVYTIANLYLDNFSLNRELVQKGQTVNITIDAVNEGGWKGYTDIIFYDGDIENTIAERTIYIDNAEMGSDFRQDLSFDWTPGSRGYHQLNMMIDYNNKIVESNEEDNVFSFKQPIFSTNYNYDLIVDGTDSKVITDEYRANGFIVVRGEGQLTIGGKNTLTQFEMKMDSNHQFGIIVEDDAKLVIDNTQMYSLDNDFDIVIKQNGELLIEEGSEIHERVGLKVEGDNSPVVQVRDSIVNGEVVVNGGEFYSSESQFTSSSMTLNPQYIEAMNTSFVADLDDFTGTEGRLIGIDASSIDVSGDGRIELYSWLRVYALSNDSHRLSGAKISISSIFTDYTVEGSTNQDGFVFLPALTNIILKDDDPFVGNYEIYGNYKETDSDEFNVGPFMRYMDDYSEGQTQTTVELRFEEVRLPELQVTDQDLYFSSEEVTEGRDVMISANIRNMGVGDAGNIEVSFFTETEGEETQIGGHVIESIESGKTHTVMFEWSAEMTDTLLSKEVRVLGIKIDTDMTPLDDPISTNNRADRTILVRSTPEFTFPKGLQMLSDGENYTEITVNEMDRLTIKSNIINTGGTSIDNASIEVTVGDILVASKSAELPSGGQYNFTAEWKVNLTGSQTVTLTVKSSKEDPLYVNQTSLSLEIEPLQIEVTNINLPKEPKVSKEHMISGFLENDQGEAISGMTVNAYIVDKNGNKASDVKSATTNNNGYFTITLKTPTEGGKYRVIFEPEYEGAGQIQSKTFEVQGEGIPWWIIAAVVGAAVAGVVFVILYLKFFGPGEYVECGNCGATIPADSTKCPKCGVEFDVDTVKCSECGNWIPADADICPECGAEFIITGEEVKEYTERMRNQYEKYKNKFKREAEEELEEELTEEEFMDWWQDQPSYLTFDEWLEREEIKRKEGSIECPECGALNSVDDAVCYKCGSTLIGLEEEEEVEEEEELPEEEEESEEEELLEEEVEEEELPEEEKTEEEKKEEVKKKVKKRPVKRRVKKKVIKKPSEKEEEPTEEESE